VLLPWFKFQKSEQNLSGSSVDIAFRDNGAHLLHFHAAHFASHIQRIAASGRQMRVASFLKEQWILALLDQLDTHSQPDPPILSITDTDLASGLSNKTLHRPVRTDHLSVIVVVEHRFLLIGTSDGNEFGIPVYIEELAIHDSFSGDFLILRSDQSVICRS
jgi:hypothetical protein